MDGFDFPAAMLAAIILVLIVKAGHKMHRHEIETGRTHRGADILIFGCVGAGLLMMAFGLDHAFLGDLWASLIGGFLGAGSVHFGLRVLDFLRQARRR